MPVDLPDNTLLVVTLVVMLVGLVGSVLPGLPGVPLIFLAALVYAIVTDFETVGGLVIAALALFAILAFVADFVGASYGARRFGASTWGTVGGLIGGLTGAAAGLLFLGIGSLFGLILGAVAGVFAGEYLRKQRDPSSTTAPQRDWRRASRAAGGVFVGYVVSAIAQGVLGVISVAIFIAALVY
jgi:uncharacterized protein YqgC (DUF456 family)